MEAAHVESGTQTSPWGTKKEAAEKREKNIYFWYFPLNVEYGNN